MAQARRGFDYGAPETTWSEGFENMPLKKRFKLQAPSQGASITSNLKSKNLGPEPAIAGVSMVGNAGNGQFCSKADSSLQKQMIATVKEEKSHADETEDVNSREDSPEKHAAAVGSSEKVNSTKSNQHHKCSSFKIPVSVKVECDDNHVEGSSAPCLKVSSLVRIQTFNCETKRLGQLDNAVFKERLTLPMSYDGFEGSIGNTAAQTSIKKLVPVKSEIPSAGDECEDVLDHVFLRERMKLFSSRGGPSQQNSKGLSKMVTSAVVYSPVGSKPAESQKVNRPRRRRRTVTSSVKTALAEDAPGLLKVLIEKGISVDEFKLYDGPESSNDLDDSSFEENLAELEEIIVKIFCKRESLLKLSHLGCIKVEKPSYCLECLFSLVEQARYLRFRQWPVEWGWCRDLLSFIFVFERHNRIVLERPEYGYATYFFELVDSLPVELQIKRLITAMKLTGCGRITILENKPLKIGDDLTEGEAKVLSEFGWIPNTGLGTMLNYFDRVVHDRKNEVKDISEWRAKIGKLLMDGYSGGKIVSASVPLEVTEHNISLPQQIKLEGGPREVTEHNISLPQQIKLEGGPREVTEHNISLPLQIKLEFS